MRLCSAARPANRFFSPQLEALEARYTPAAPSLTLSQSVAGQNTFLLSGRVTDEQPGGLTVQLSGVYTGTVETDANGNFNITIQPSQLGSVFAQVTDNEQLTSASVERVLSSLIPTIVTFSAQQMGGRIWTFSGSVSDEHAAGLIVTFGGLPSLVGKTAVVDANGNFSLTLTLQPGESGLATAQTSDWWSQLSAQASCEV